VAPCSPAHGEQAFTASAGAEILFPPTAIGWQLDVGPEMGASRRLTFLVLSDPVSSVCQGIPKRVYVSTGDKPLRWLEGVLDTPPVSREAKREAGLLLRRLQRGESLGMPESRPMPAIGKQVHELRVRDAGARVIWRIVYRVDRESVLVVHWRAKKTEQTAKRDLDLCKRRLRAYDER
jgi:phage-related protein